MKYTTVQADRKKFGPSGFRYRLISTSKEISDLAKDKTLRAFEFVGCFSKQISFSSEEIKASISINSGSSYFLAPEKVPTPTIATPLGTYSIHSNSQKEFSSITFSCNSHNIDQAYQLFYSGISRLSGIFGRLPNNP